MQVENVLSQLEVLTLQRAIVLLHVLKFLDLLLELLDVALFALTERALYHVRNTRMKAEVVNPTCAARFCAALLLVDSSRLPFPP